MLESVNLCIKHMLSCGEGPKRSADTKMHLYYSPKISVLLTCRTTWDSPSLKLASLSIPLTWKMASAHNFKFSCHLIRTSTNIYTKLPSLQHIRIWTKTLNPISIGLGSNTNLLLDLDTGTYLAEYSETDVVLLFRSYSSRQVLFDLRKSRDRRDNGIQKGKFAVNNLWKVSNSVRKRSSVAIYDECLWFHFCFVSKLSCMALTFKVSE